MRKVVISVYTTLDGVMEAPEKWSGQFWNEEHGTYARDLLFASDALLIGREIYEGFAASWPFRTAADDGPGEEGFVDRINSLPKFVASTTHILIDVSRGLVGCRKSATLVEPTGESSSDFVAWLVIDSDHLAKTVPRPPGSQAAIGLVPAAFCLKQRGQTGDPA